MKEIKFRAWDKKKNQFINKYKIHNITKMTEINEIFDDSNIVWLQFTGLKDKNGKEIYEGDIVKFQGYHFTKNKEIGQVFFQEYKYVFGNKKWGVRGLNKCEIDLCKVKVIGNIYENPGLLKKCN